MLKVKDSAGNVGLGPEQEAALLDHPWLSWLPTSARHEAEASSYLHVLAWPGFTQQKARALGAGMATPAVPLAISDKPLTQWDLNTAARCADCSSSLT